jgi:predicted acylesterase/phospholipase RssA
MHIFLKISILLFIASLSINAKIIPEKKPIDLSMVISGGVSLGAYEAGYNWAMIKMLSHIRDHSQIAQPKLRSVTGASAGSINALLTAIYWCQKPEIDDSNSIENNLFYNTWVDLGLSDLIITDPKSNNKSTLFKRDKLKIKSEKILEKLKKPIFRKGCKIPLGFSVTKAKPITTEFQNSGIKIKNQHFSIPLTLKEKNNKLTLSNRKMSKSTDYYISIPNIEEDNSKVIDVLFASSAFPGAFKQIKLDYLYEGEKKSSYFIDGGAYDNLPLQLATELDKQAKEFIFIDPSNMRKEKERYTTLDEEKEPIGFLTSNAIPLLDSLDIFQSMRLYNAITQYFQEGSGKQLILSSRYHPITGKFLGHFGAFLDKDFRIYDYHVGVYDAIYHLSKAMKQRGYMPNIELQTLMLKQKIVLGMDENPKALSAFNLFFSTEFSPKKPVVIKDMFSNIYFAFNKQLNDAERYNLTEFKTFLQKLNPKYLTDSHSFIPRDDKSIQNWYKRPLQLLINRITVLENNYADIEGNSKVFANVTNMMAWMGNNFVKKQNGFDFLPMSIPQDVSNPILANTLRILPNEINTDVKNGGIGFAYNIYSYQEENNDHGYESKIALQQSDDMNNFFRLDVNMFQEKKDFIKFGIGGSLFGKFNQTFYDTDSLYGANAYVDILDIFRLTYVHRWGETQEKNFIYFGIENLPSLIYWLQR